MTDSSIEVLATLRQIIRAMDVHSKQLSKLYGLTGPQLVLLKEIAKNEYISVSELAKRASLSQATVTSIIDRLEAKGFVSRIRSEADKRKVILEVTAKAREKLNNKPSVLQEEFVRKFNGLEEWEQSLLISSLQRIVSMMSVADNGEKILTEEMEQEKSV
jgi:DNA-binding MarR family transcriptional regulator